MGLALLAEREMRWPQQPLSHGRTASGPGFATGKPVQNPHLAPMKKPYLLDRASSLEGQVGLEPTTFCLRGRRSNQLSY